MVHTCGPQHTLCIPWYQLYAFHSWREKEIEERNDEDPAPSWHNVPALLHSVGEATFVMGELKNNGIKMQRYNGSPSPVGLPKTRLCGLIQFGGKGEQHSCPFNICTEVRILACSFSCPVKPASCLNEMARNPLILIPCSFFSPSGWGEGVWLL